MALILQKNLPSEVGLVELKGTNGNGNKFSVLFQGLLDGTIETDEDVSRSMFNSERDDPMYKRFKTQSKQEFINYLFFLNLNNSERTARQRAHYTCYKEWAAVKILLSKNAWIAAKSIAIKVYKLAKKFEFTDLLVEVSKMMRLYYSTRVGDLKKYEYYSALYKEHVQLRDAEEKAEEFYTDLIVRFVKKKGYDEKIEETAKKYFENIRPLAEQHKSYWLQLYAFMIEFVMHSTIVDYEKVIDVCGRAIHYFEDKNYKADVALQAFFYQKIVAHTQLKQYELGIRTAERGIKLLEEGSSNWFIYQDWSFVLSMHTADYEKAAQVFINVIHQKRFTLLPANSQELWNIYEAYLAILVELNYIENQGVVRYFKKFKKSRFTNLAPTFSQDKRGMNIPVLIAQILLMLMNKEYGNTENRIEAIQKYSTRYLRKNDTYRSNCFIKMLIQIPAASFHKQAVIRKAKPYVGKLNEVPLEAAKQSSEIEIIPYENLWALTLSLLDSKRHVPRRRNTHVDKVKVLK